MSHEMCFNAGAETVQRVEGNMSGAVMRGPVALPGSETSSRTKGPRRNLGDLIALSTCGTWRGRAQAPSVRVPQVDSDAADQRTDQLLDKPLACGARLWIEADGATKQRCRRLS